MKEIQIKTETEYEHKIWIRNLTQASIVVGNSNNKGLYLNFISIIHIFFK